jgi:metal-responsive CopG/Arc/MetJ family transcriptional regulator
MYSLQQIEKQQVGLRLPKYLVDDIDEFTHQFSLNRSEIITEAIKAFITEQKANMFYSSFDKSCKEVIAIENNTENTTTLNDLIDELKNNTNT